MDFERNPHFLDHLVIGQTAKMVMKVARIVQMSGNRVEQISGLGNNIMILAQGSVDRWSLK